MGLAVADGEGEIGKLGRQAGEIGMSTEEEEMGLPEISTRFESADFTLNRQLYLKITYIKFY